MARQPRSQDSLIVGLLLIIVVMMAYMIFVQPVRPPSPNATTAANGGQPGAANGGQPGAVQPTPGAAGQATPGAAGQPSPGAAGQPNGAAGGAVPGRMGPLHMREFLAGIVALDKAGKLTSEQARALLPVMQQYAQMTSAVPDARNLLVDLLTPDQKAYIEKNVTRGPPSPDPKRTAEEALSESVKKLLDALQSR